jgi:MFS family permease
MSIPATDPRRVLVGAMLVLLLGAINQTIVAVALPRIAERLDGFGLLAWAIGFFALGSLGCALSTSIPMRVAFRVLQGAGGGGLISGAHAASALSVSPRERGRYQAYFSSMFALASVLGPVAGGWMTERLSWQWVFAANLPLAAAALAVIRVRLRPLPVPGRDRPIDAAGDALLSLGLAALLNALSLGPPAGSLIAGRTMSATGRYRPQQRIGALGAAVAVAIAFDAPHWVGVALLSTLLLELLRGGAPQLASVSVGGDVMRAPTATGADALRARMQPVAEVAFEAVFAVCAVRSVVVLALLGAMPEQALRG